VSTAAACANSDVFARYDARNQEALRKLVAGGTPVCVFNPALMDTFLKTSNEINAEAAATKPDFKKIYESLMAFKNEEYLWWQMAEYSYDSLMIPVAGPRLIRRRRR
jgi:TRAP-type mannitol/chloroaromatic compound transport system substrate-binding protein